MNIKSVILPVMLLCSSSLQADNVSEERACELAQQFFSQSSNAHVQSKELLSNQELRLEAKAARAYFQTKTSRQLPSAEVGGSNYYYIFNRGSNNGFVIVSGDDGFPTYLGYSLSGRINAQNYPDGLKWFLETVRQIMDESARTGKARDFSSLGSAEANSKVPAFVLPLLGDIRWNQNAPFNDLAPASGSAAHAPTGCTATAFSQVVSYHKYPEHSYGVVNSTNPTLTVDLNKDGAYDYNLMITNIDNGYTSEQAAMTAKLNYHLGVACDMNYHETGSSGDMIKAANAMVENFKYGKDFKRMEINFLGRDKFNEAVRSSLAAGYPVPTQGSNIEMAHAFVLDGYNSDGLYHVNWGWGGQSNGYYDLGVMNPYEGTSSDFGYKWALISYTNLHPDKESVAVGASPILIGSDIKCNLTQDGTFSSSENPNEGLGVYVYFYKYSLYGVQEINCKVGIAAVSTTDKKQYLGSAWVNGPFDSYAPNYTGYNCELKTNGKKLFENLPDGEYDLFPVIVYSDSADAAARIPFAMGGSYKNTTRIKVSQSGAHWEKVAKEALPLKLQIIDGSCGYDLKSSGDGSLSFGLENTGQDDFSQTVAIKGAVYSEGTTYSKNFGYADVQLAPGEKRLYEVAISGWGGYDYPDIQPVLEYKDEKGAVQTLNLIGRVDTYNKKSRHSITLEHAGQGMLTTKNGESLQNVVYGTNLQLNVKPAEGYRLSSFLVNGFAADSEMPLRIVRNTIIKAVFEKADDPTTGIENAEARKEKIGKGIFSADGRKLSDDGNDKSLIHFLQKGLYIINGEKVFVK